VLSRVFGKNYPIYSSLHRGPEWVRRKCFELGLQSGTLGFFQIRLVELRAHEKALLFVELAKLGASRVTRGGFILEALNKSEKQLGDFMYHNFKSHLLITLASLLLLSGCATSRSVISLESPKFVPTVVASDKTVFINSVVDKRVFEVNPDEPKTPSLDPDETQGDSIKVRAIARKRNTYGKGLGDILLPEGQSVETLIASYLSEAFKAKGYRVISSKELVKPDTYLVNARIDKFWSWMNPGFWSIALNTEITTELAIERGADKHQKSISVSESDNFQAATESNWIEVMNKALKAYMANASQQIQ